MYFRGAAIQPGKQLILNPFCLGGQKTQLDGGPQGLGFVTPGLFAHIEPFFLATTDITAL